MSKKFQTDKLYEHIGSYNFLHEQFLLPVINTKQSTLISSLSASTEFEFLEPKYNLEPFKYKNIPIHPSTCIYTFMTEIEVLEVKNMKSRKKLESFFDKKLNSFIIKGISKKLLIEFLISIVKFSNRYLYDSQQTSALLAIFYNTHLYFTYYLFATPEDIYGFFKQYIYYHSVTFPPNKVKIFEVNESKQIILYFCSIYIRNLPLVRMLMLPSYGLILKTKNPEPEEDVLALSKKKKDKKGKKDKDKKDKKDKKKK